MLQPHRFWMPIHGRPMYGRVFTPTATNTPPFVLVHGVGVSGRYMFPTARVLAGTHRVFVPDLPGFGKSTALAHIHNIPELADDLAAWMQALRLTGTCLIANSLGCQVVLDLALRYPELAQWAVLIGPTGDPTAGSVPVLVWRGSLDMLHEPLSYWPLLVWDYLRAGTVRTLMTLHYGVLDPVVNKLPHISIPTLVLRGSRDPIAPQPWIEEMARLLPQGKMGVIEGAAHAANYSAPRKVAQAVRAFIKARGWTEPIPGYSRAFTAAQSSLA